MTPKMWASGLFTHLQKLLQQAYKSSFMWIQWKFFQKIVETYILTHFHPILSGSPKYRASETHILNTFKSNSNEHVKQNLCEFGGNFWQNSQKPFYVFGGPKWPDNLGLWGHFYTPTKVAATGL